MRPAATVDSSQNRALSEVFVHCKGTARTIDLMTGAKRNPDQVDNALDFLSDFVRTTSPRYALLSAMRPAETVDFSQSCEADIVVAILGTTEVVGPGFITDEHRFNVMLSRQKGCSFLGISMC